MKHAILGVIAGYAAWTGLWLGGNAAFFGAAAEAVEGGEAFTDTGPLAAILAWSAVCSLVAGALTAWLAKGGGTRAGLALGVLLLLTGIGVQASAWSQLPVWYHLAFLVLLIPVVLLGGRLAPRRPVTGQ